MCRSLFFLQSHRSSQGSVYKPISEQVADYCVFWSNRKQEIHHPLSRYQLLWAHHKCRLPRRTSSQVISRLLPRRNRRIMEDRSSPIVESLRLPRSIVRTYRPIFERISLPCPVSLPLSLLTPLSTHPMPQVDYLHSRRISRHFLRDLREGHPLVDRVSDPCRSHSSRCS